MKPLYILRQRHHWCSDQVAKAANAQLFLLKDKFIPKKLRALLFMIFSPFIALFLPNRNIYLASTINGHLILKFYKFFFKRKFLTVHIGFDDFFSDNHKGIKRKFMYWASSGIDAAIVQSTMAEKEIRRNFSKTIPIEINPHFPKDDHILTVKADLKSKNVITIGITPRLRKGTDIFVELAKINPKIHFYLLGKTESLSEKFIDDMKKIPNLTFTGWQEPTPYISKCTFFLLPARYDSGPIALLEAMMTGLIPIVSSNVGSQDSVIKVKEDLVIDSLNPKDFDKRLNALLKLSDNELTKLSNKSIKAGRLWTHKNGMMDMEEKFKKIIKCLQLRKL